MRFRYLEHEELYAAALARALGSARASIWIATATLKATMVADPRRRKVFRPVAEALAELARGGTEVLLLHAGNPSKPFAEALRKTRARELEAFQLRRCPRPHFKAIIVDGRAAYVGSANLTGAGLGAKQPKKRNFEIGFWFEDDGVVGRVRDLFSAIWRGSFCGGCGLAEHPDREKRCPGILG